MSAEIQALVDVVFEATTHSSRHAKRFLREAGSVSPPRDLAVLLAEYKSHPQKAEIDRLVEERAAAERAVLESRLSGDTDASALPPWLFAETRDGTRQFLIHNCPGGAWSFQAEVLQDKPRDGMECYPLADSQWLGNITWIDDRPERAYDRKQLMQEARRVLAEYHAGLDIDASDSRRGCDFEF
ncbi:MAG: hypothetical protein E6R03_13755 [Hyphomicrobiaceae bacterium]|nr:MAG: hypothetical protein E6R03_13755 [Hyphomicrobiaceae bacterium]